MISPDLLSPPIAVGGLWLVVATYFGCQRAWRRRRPSPLAARRAG